MISKNQIEDTLARVHKSIDELGRQRNEFAAEGAGLLALFEVVMNIVHGKEDRAEVIKERLSLAVRGCNHATTTAKAIRQFEADGMDKLLAELKKSVEEGLSAEYRPGADLCLGMVEALARKGRQSL
ncbi:hypothetical protein FDK32_16295 [Citrobacter freundii]|uniref:hypothetical protein n=1 Tax=Citrobacter freundii TaxID=546 RepID=UPI001BA85D02|nr:hypothetical protein [Citrobacter freundii]MBQ5149436.1 hypothetical protein [Citrobacter freundii]